MVDYVLSIDSAALLTDTSKRTLWRHLSAGKLQRHGMDERGRVMLSLTELASSLCVALSAEMGGGMTIRCLWRLTGAIAGHKTI